MRQVVERGQVTHKGRRYGFRTFGDYFTPRQLVALTTFSDLVTEAPGAGGA